MARLESLERQLLAEKALRAKAEERVRLDELGRVIIRLTSFLSYSMF